MRDYEVAQQPPAAKMAEDGVPKSGRLRSRNNQRCALLVAGHVALNHCDESVKPLIVIDHFLRQRSDNRVAVLVQRGEVANNVREVGDLVHVLAMLVFHQRVLFSDDFLLIFEDFLLPFDQLLHELNISSELRLLADYEFYFSVGFVHLSPVRGKGYWPSHIPCNPVLLGRDYNTKGIRIERSFRLPGNLYSETFYEANR